MAEEACINGDWVPWKNYMKELGMDESIYINQPDYVEPDPPSESDGSDYDA